MDGKCNMAFKVNYCNGRTDPDDKRHFGFRGLCSPGVIEYNIKKRNAHWCSNPACGCRQFFDGVISYEELQELAGSEDGMCMESRLLRTWTAYAEYSHAGETWEARTIRNTEVGSLAVLTTVRPQMDERNRKIFAAFLIDDVFEGDEEYCGEVTAHPTYRIELTLGEANTLNFWDFYENENTTEARWGHGVFRYLYDSCAARILKEIAAVKKGTSEEALAAEMYRYYCKMHPHVSSK